MNTENDQYPQTPPRLRDIYVPSPVYFVTCCTYQRQNLLANDAIHLAFLDFARRGGTGRCIAVGRYVIMPDHLHLFVRGSYDFRLSIWVNLLKGCLTKQIRGNLLRDGFNNDFSRLPVVKVWQRGFFDHVLRSRESYSEKWQYVEQNPVRAGLVKKAEHWLYTGEINPIRL